MRKLIYGACTGLTLKGKAQGKLIGFPLAGPWRIDDFIVCKTTSRFSGPDGELMPDPISGHPGCVLAGQLAGMRLYRFASFTRIAINQVSGHRGVAECK